MSDEETDLMEKLVDALRHSRPHVYAGVIMGKKWIKGAKAVVDEIDVALIEADEVIHWSDKA